MNQNELYHFGIRGMRWGVRRYQNADGSLTAAGKKKYGTKTNFEKVKSAKLKAQGKDPKSIREKERAKANARTQKEIDKYTKKKKNKDADIDEEKKTKSIKDMSDDELKEITNRLNTEKNFYEAQKNHITAMRQLSELEPKKVNKGKEFLKGLFNNVILPNAIDAGTEYINRTIRSVLGEKDPLGDLKKAAEIAGYEKKIAEAESAKRKNRQESERERQSNNSGNSGNGGNTNTADNSGKSSNNTKTNSDNKRTETYSGTVEGEGTSRRKTKNKFDNSDAVDGVFREMNNRNNSSNPYDDQLLLEGKQYLLEDKRKKRLKHGGVDMNQNELYHYGVVGMKWGVHRSASKQKAISRLERKAFNYDKKSANFTKKSEKQHAKHDLERSNRNAIKAAKLSKKAAKVNKKALKTDNDFRKVMLQKKAAKLNYKSEKAEIKGNRISKTTGYGMEAMKYAIKSDKMAAKAAKARMKIAKNKAYIEMTKRKVNSLSGEDLQKGKEYIAKLNIE